MGLAILNYVVTELMKYQLIDLNGNMQNITKFKQIF